MTYFDLLTKRFLVGHRGVPELELENTLQSIQRAIEFGAQVVEVDIQRTRDGVLVLSHDENIKRTFGVDKNIHEGTWQEIKGVEKDGHRLARLEEALELVGGKAGMFLEVKHPEDAQEVYKKVLEHRAADWTAIISFYPQALEELKGKITTGLVYSKPPGMIPEAKRLGCLFALPKYGLATQKAVDFAHRLKLKVVAWTVNDPQKARELFERGVDGIATDCVKTLKVQLSSILSSP